MNGEERAARMAAKARKAGALAARLRALRGLRALSQTELARRAGLARQLLAGLEKGARVRPEPATLEKLADALGATVEQLRGREVIPELAAGAPPAASPAPTAAEGPDYVTSLGLLPALPPGTTVIQRRNPDGSTEVYLHIPGPCERDHGNATDEA